MTHTRAISFLSVFGHTKANQCAGEAWEGTTSPVYQNCLGQVYCTGDNEYCKFVIQ